MNTGTYNNYKFHINKIKDTDRVADFRSRVQELYGIEPSSYMITWVFDMKLINIFNNQQTIKEMTDNTKGVMLLFEIPKELNPKMPPITQIKKDDSNYGIDEDWTKVCVHIYKDSTLLNLPRFIWARKSWTLEQLHYEFFNLYKDLFYRWYKDIEDAGKSDRCKSVPHYKHP